MELIEQFFESVVDLTVELLSGLAAMLWNSLGGPFAE